MISKYPLVLTIYFIFRFCRRLDDFLNRCGVSFTLLSMKTPPEQVLPPGQPRWRYARGVVQRNRGLQWLRENFRLDRNEGVVYMADDDNTYSLRLFDEVPLIFSQIL